MHSLDIANDQNLITKVQCTLSDKSKSPNFAINGRDYFSQMVMFSSKSRVKKILAMFSPEKYFSNFVFSDKGGNEIYRFNPQDSQ